MKALLSHLVIMLSGILLTLVTLDHFNSAMAFLDNDITKALMGILCLTAGALGVLSLKASR